MTKKHLIRLDETLRSLETDPATAEDPIKRMFVCDGEHVSANVNILEDAGDAIHIQPLHDEIAFVVDDEVWLAFTWKGPHGIGRDGTQISLENGMDRAERLVDAIRECNDE